MRHDFIVLFDISAARMLSIFKFRCWLPDVTGRSFFNESHWLLSHQPVSADGKPALTCFVHARSFFSALDAFSLQCVSFFFFFSSTLLACFPFCLLDLISFFILIRSYSLFFILYGFKFRSDGRFLIRQDRIESMRKMRNCLPVRAGARLSSSFHFNERKDRNQAKTRRNMSILIRADLIRDRQ